MVVSIPWIWSDPNVLVQAMLIYWCHLQIPEDCHFSRDLLDPCADQIQFKVFILLGTEIEYIREKSRLNKTSDLLLNFSWLWVVLTLTASDHRVIWKEQGKRWLSPNLKYFPKSYLEWLREPTKNLTVFMLILITFKTIINNKGYTTRIYGMQSLQNEYKQYEVKVFWNVTLYA
jgi:hypothetical protein